MRRVESKGSRSFRVLATGWALAGLFATATLAAGTPPETSSDGLELLKNTKARIVYAKPGASLKSYARVMLLDCFVEFQKSWQREYNLEEVGLSGRVTDKDADAIKQRLAKEFKEVFTKRLVKKGHVVVDAPAPDVLLLRPALINVEITAPQTRMAGRSREFIRSAGSMTLVLELYDSTTSTLLARVIDPQTDVQPFPTEASRATNKFAADHVLQHWADLLASHLGEARAGAEAK